MSREQRLSFIGISLALFLAALDQTIVTTALPRIVEELGGLNYYAWVVTAYLLASVLGLPFFGRLIELFPAKWVLLIAVSVFLGSVVFLPLYLVHVKGFSATNSGLSITPLVMGVVVGSTLGGQLASRFGRYKAPLITSLCIGIIAFAAFAFNLRVETPLWQVIPLMVVIGLCLGPSLPLYTLAVQNAVPRSRLGTATSTLQFVRQVGSTASVALMGAVLATTISATAAGSVPPEMRDQMGEMAIGEGSDSMGSLTAKVEQRFAALEQQAVAALNGDESARQALLSDPALPPGFASRLQPAGIRDQVRTELAQSLDQVEAALAGNAAARDAALQDPLIPQEAKSVIADPPASATARSEFLVTIQQRLQAQEEGIVSDARTRVLSQVQAELRGRAAEAAEALTSAFNAGITAALQRVYTFATAFMLFSFLAALLLPDLELGGAVQSRREDGPLPADAS